MSGDFTPMYHDLPDSPEFLAILEATGATTEEVFFRLWSYWRLVDRQVLGNVVEVDGERMGVLAKCGPRALAARCGGSPDFWEAVARVTVSPECPRGWAIFRDGDTLVPGWDKQFSNTAKKRRKESQRKKKEYYRGKADDCDGDEGKQDVADEQEKAPAPAPVKLPGKAEEVLAVFGHYRTYHPRAFANPGPDSKEWRAIKARLAEGYSVDDLRAAIDGCHRTPHNLGQNDRGQTYLALGLIVRDGSQVSRFMEAPQSTGNLSAGQRRSLDAARAFVERGNGKPNQTNLEGFDNEGN